VEKRLANNELQRTSDGTAAGSPLNSVLSGPQTRESNMTSWLKATFVSVGAAVVTGWCTALVLVLTFTTPPDRVSVLSDRGALVNVLAAALLASLIPAATGGLMGGVLAGLATTRRIRQSKWAWCLKGAVLGFSLGCAVALLYGAALGAGPPALMVFGVPGAAAGAFAGAAVGWWCARASRGFGGRVAG
jgi:hypothetical protein